MKTTHVIYLALLAFAAGLLAGMWPLSHHYENLERTLRIRPEEDKADVALRALHHLRGNSTNALDFLETQLDVGVIDLGNILATMPRSAWSRADVELLRSVREYRAKFPRKSELEERVSSVLSLLEQNGNQ